MTGTAIVVGAVTIAAGIAGLARGNALALTAGSTVLLADVRNETGDSLFGGALRTAAAIGLAQSSHLAVHPAGHAGAVPLDEAGARQVARKSNVARVIALGIDRRDSLFRLSVRLIDPGNGGVLLEAAVESPPAGVVDGLDGLLATVREKLGEPESSLRESSHPLRHVASPSLAAIDAYGSGMQALRAGNGSAARAAWGRALALDSTFALVEVALATEAFQRGAEAEGETWMKRASTHLVRLPPQEALRVRQTLAMQSGNYREAARLATEMAQRSPTRDAWLNLASVHLAEGNCEAAVPALTKAAGLDSTDARARLSLARCAQQKGDVQAALGHFTAAQRLDPVTAGKAPHVREWGLALARAGRVPDAAAAFRKLASGGASLDSAEGLRALAALAAYRGRFGEAAQLLQRVTRVVRRAGSPDQLRAALVLEAEVVLALGARTYASQLVDEAVLLSMTHPAPPVGYVHLGQLMTRMGRINGARELLRYVTARVAPQGTEAQWAERLLSASVQLAERNAAGALSALNDVVAPPALEPFRLAATADARAMAGQHDAALAAARRLSEGWYLDCEAQDEWMRASLRVARVAEARGDTAGALDAYRRYVDRWKDADGYVVELANAQRSLARLGARTVALGR